MNEARKHLFTRCSISIENIPLMEATLLEHCKQATFQGGYTWGQTLTLNQVLPSPLEWGWQYGCHRWHPYWTTLSEALRACHEFICCGRTKAYRGLCKCKRNELSCTELCLCAKEDAPNKEPTDTEWNL